MLPNCSLQLVFPNAYATHVISSFFPAISWELFYTPESPEMIELDQSRARVRSSCWVAVVMCPNIIWWCSDRPCFCDRMQQKEMRDVWKEFMSPEELSHGQVHLYTWSYLRRQPWPSINDILLTCLWWRTIISWVSHLLEGMSNNSFFYSSFRLRHL